jgi:hypothetical protein
VSLPKLGPVSAYKPAHVEASSSSLSFSGIFAASRGADTRPRQFRIEWQVVNRFRMFRDPQFFKLHENAWRQYLLHVDNQGMASDERDAFIARTSVLGSEHVLNDRYIAFSNISAQEFRLARLGGPRPKTCCAMIRRSAITRPAAASTPISNPIATPSNSGSSARGAPVPKQARCEWRIGGQLVAEASCGERVSGPGIALPYPGGAEISVNVVGEQPVFVDAAVRDLLIAGLGDSFASGEGNPNTPVQFGDGKRHRNFYPLRKRNDGFGSASWTDQLCHRSLYGQQLRAALQIAIEHPQAAVTFLDYSCSGAGIEAGLLGPQVYVERIADTDYSSSPATGDAMIRPATAHLGRREGWPALQAGARALP